MITQDSYLNEIKKSNLVCCSELTRSVETAMLLFRGSSSKKNILNILPYISEKRAGTIAGDSDNLPSTLDKLRENIDEIKQFYNTNLKNKCSDLDLPLVDFEIINHFRGIGGVPTEPSFDNFLNRVPFQGKWRCLDFCFQGIPLCQECNFTAAGSFAVNTRLPIDPPRSVALLALHLI